MPQNEKLPPFTFQIKTENLSQEIAPPLTTPSQPDDRFSPCVVPDPDNFTRLYVMHHWGVSEVGFSPSSEVSLRDLVDSFSGLKPERDVLGMSGLVLVRDARGDALVHTGDDGFCSILFPSLLVSFDIEKEELDLQSPISSLNRVNIPHFPKYNLKNRRQLGYVDCIEFVSNCVDIQLKRVKVLLQQRKEINSVVVDLEKMKRTYTEEVVQLNRLFEKIQQNKESINFKVVTIEKQIKQSLDVLSRLENFSVNASVLSKEEKDYFSELVEIRRKLDAFRRKLKGFNEIANRQKKREGKVPLPLPLEPFEVMRDHGTDLVPFLRANGRRTRTLLTQIDDLKARLDQITL